MSKKPPPKDRQILIEHEYGTSVAIWNEPDNRFAYADLQVDLYEGTWDMRYFETKSIKEEEILNWKEL